MKTAALPTGLLASDLTPPRWSDAMQAIPYDDRRFELWFVLTFGWVIPTLHISTAKRAGQANRTYATRVSDGATVRVGLGPHVTARHTVYLRPARVKALQRYLDLRREGAGNAGMVRDRISSRRAQGQLERASGAYSWRWNV